MITKKEVASKHRQGRGWIVNYYSPSRQAWVESHEMDYFMACGMVRSCRETWSTKAQDYDA